MGKKKKLLGTKIIMQIEIEQNKLKKILTKEYDNGT